MAKRQKREAFRNRVKEEEQLPGGTLSSAAALQAEAEANRDALIAASDSPTNQDLKQQAQRTDYEDIYQDDDDVDDDYEDASPFYRGKKQEESLSRTQIATTAPPNHPAHEYETVPPSFLQRPAASLNPTPSVSDTPALTSLFEGIAAWFSQTWLGKWFSASRETTQASALDQQVDTVHRVNPIYEGDSDVDSEFGMTQQPHHHHRVNNPLYESAGSIQGPNTQEGPTEGVRRLLAASRARVAVLETKTEQDAHGATVEPAYAQVDKEAKNAQRARSQQLGENTGSYSSETAPALPPRLSPKK